MKATVASGAGALALAFLLPHLDISAPLALALGTSGFLLGLSALIAVARQ